MQENKSIRLWHFPKEMYHDFQNSYIRESLNVTRYAICLCIALYASFLILDYNVYPQAFTQFLIIRLGVVIPYSFLILALTFSKLYERIGQILLSGLILLAGLGIVLMIQLSNGFLASTYYIGIVLVLMFGFTFIRIQFKYSIPSGIGLLVVFTIVVHNLEVDHITKIQSIFFLYGAFFIASLSSYYNEMLARKKYMLNRSLIEEKQRSDKLNRELETRVALRTKELEQANNTVLKAMEEAQNSDKLKSAFLANMSHEIRTPMNGILGFSELLQEPDTETKDVAWFSEIIHNNSIRLLRIIDDLIDISKIEAGEVIIRPSEISLTKLLLEAIDLFQTPDMNPNSLEFHHNLDGFMNLQVYTDHAKLSQIVINLIQNAIKYTPSGSITINLRMCDNNEIGVSITDTGLGISKEDQQHIFDRFRQGEQLNKMPNKGVGLGLAITSAYIKYLNGRIEVESEPGIGSCFQIIIPKVFEE